MGALATHLFYAEPANFALVALLRTEALKNICLQAADGQLELLSILCNLFCCIPLQHSLAEAVKTKKIAGPSKVLLEPLHPNLVNILERENESAMVTLRDYWDLYVRKNESDLPAETALPLSGIVFPRADGEGGGGGGGGGGGKDVLERYSLKYRLRSSFAALSGLDDEFTSVHELCATVRNGLYMDPKVGGL